MTEFLQTAIEAARIGGRILNDNLMLRAEHQIDRKQQFDFVTQVDTESEAAIIDFITQRHPDHTILAEESGSSEKAESQYRWIIDPLDGTKNYIHAFPTFAVSIALQHDRELLAGAILDPLRDELFYAEKDKGAFLNDQPVRVTQSTDLSQCLLATGFPFRAKHLTSSYFDAFIALFHKVSDFRRAGAAALDLAYVACGRLDGFWEITLNPWDVAAGILIIEEAGGKATDLWGGDSHLQHGHIVASNGLIHDEITTVVGNVFEKKDLLK